MADKETLEHRLKQLEEILDLQVEIGEDTSIVISKIQEIEKMLKKYQ